MQVFKPFDSASADLNFSLNKITDVYSDFNSGKEIYFLNAENKEVRVKSITKQEYSGKIYDVDVPNDIVLVRRNNNNNNNSGINNSGINNSGIWSGNSNNGTCSGASCPTYTGSGKFGKGLIFNGSNSIDLPNDLGYTSQVSAFAWFKSNGVPPGAYHIIFGGQELEISIPSSGGAIRTGVYTNARFVSNHGSGLTDGNWHFVGFTFNGTNKSSYIDGVYVGNQAVTGSLTYSFSNRKIGRYGSSSTYYLNGSLDDVRIYGYALSAQEINASYNAGLYKLYNNFTSLSNGVYNYTAYAQDLAGNVNQTETRNVTVDYDYTAPTATQGTNPIDNYNSSSNLVTFDMKCYDNVAVSMIQLWTNTTGTWHANYSNSSYANNTWLNITVTGIPQAQNYKWAVWCNDTSALTNITQNRTFAVDTTSPTVTLPVYTNATKYRNTQTLVYNISVTDSGSGPGYCSIGVGTNSNITVQVTSGWCNGTNYALTGLSDGNKTIYAYANDSVGNVALNNSYVVWLDSTNPVAVQGANPIDYYNSSNTTIVFDAKCSDNVGVSALQIWANDTGTWQNKATQASPTNDTWYNVSVSGLTASRFYWGVKCNDTVNNVGWSSNRTLTIDTTPPVIIWENPTPGNASNQSYNYVTLNTTITDILETSAFFDWNRTLVGYWAMDFYNSTGIYDNSSYDNFMTFGGSGPSTSNLTTGKYGNALEFDGVNDYVWTSGTKLILLPSTSTYEVWFKVNAFTSYAAVVSNLKFNAPASGYNIIPNWVGAQRITICAGNGIDGYVYREFTEIPALTTGVWYHVVVTYDGTKFRVFVNGDYKAEWTQVLAQINQRFILGRWAVNYGEYYFNGTIDEVQIYSRALSPQEINASYNNGLYRLYNNFTSLSDGNYTYKAYAIDAVGNLNITAMRQVAILAGKINMSYVSPTPSNGSRQIANSVTINVSVNGTNNIDTCLLSWNSGGGYANETMTKEGSGTSVFCSKTKSTNDGTTYWYMAYANDTSGLVNSTGAQTFRENAKPSAPTLSSPADLNHTTNRTPEFSWAGLSDDDGDTITTELNITPNCASFNCDSGDIKLKNITNNGTSYTLTQGEKFKNLYSAGDYNDNYTWKVIAWDGYEWSTTWSSSRTIFIDSEVMLTLIDNTVNFGSMINGQQNDTTTDNPYPLLLQNDGNCYVDVNLSSSDLLWDAINVPSNYYMYKIDKYLTWDSFNWTSSQTTWAQVPINNATTIRQFNYIYGNNRSEMDINVTVPNNESGGVKSSLVTLTGYYIHDPE